MPYNPQLYQRHKAAGRCPKHPRHPAVPGYTFCEACLDAMLTPGLTSAHLQALHVYRAQRTQTPITDQPAASSPQADGPRLACRGQWVPITQVPFRCRACGKQHFWEAFALYGRVKEITASVEA